MRSVLPRSSSSWSFKLNVDSRTSLQTTWLGVGSVVRKQCQDVREIPVPRRDSGHTGLTSWHKDDMIMSANVT